MGAVHHEGEALLRVAAAGGRETPSSPLKESPASMAAAQAPLETKPMDVLRVNEPVRRGRPPVQGEGVELVGQEEFGEPAVAAAEADAHGRRKLFELAEVARPPLAIEAVRRIDAIFAAERAINGLPAERRLAVRQQHIAPLVAELETWMRRNRGRLSRHNDVAKAMDYMLKRWDTFARFLGDGHVCLTNNAAERALRGIALGRKSWLFAGSDRGGERAAAMYSLIVTAKLNDVDPRAWLADVLARIADHPASRLHELLPWNWRKPPVAATTAA